MNAVRGIVLVTKVQTENNSSVSVISRKKFTSAVSRNRNDAKNNRRLSFRSIRGNDEAYSRDTSPPSGVINNFLYTERLEYSGRSVRLRTTAENKKRENGEDFNLHPPFPLDGHLPPHSPPGRPCLLQSSGEPSYFLRRGGRRKVRGMASRGDEEEGAKRLEIS